MSALSIECTIQKLIILSFEKVMVDSPKGCEGPRFFFLILNIRTYVHAYEHSFDFTVVALNDQHKKARIPLGPGYRFLRIDRSERH